MYKILLTVFLFSLCAAGNAQQVDYLELRADLTSINCTTRDTNVVNTSLHLLEPLNPDTISENKDHYYSDLYNAFYFKFLMSRDSAYLEKISTVPGIAREEYPEITKVLWESAFTSAYFFNDCESSMKYLQRYIRYSEPEVIEDNQEQIDFLRTKCEGEAGE